VTLVAGIALLLLVLGLIGYPLLRPVEEEDLAEDPTDESMEEALVEKENVLTALSELEYDYRMHKISAEDYRALKEALTSEAITFLQDEDERPVTMHGRELDAEIEEEIEREVAALAGRSGRAESGTGVGEGGKVPEDAPGSCPACGTSLIEEGQGFCHRCGHEIANV